MAGPIAPKPAPGKLGNRIRSAKNPHRERAAIHVEHFKPITFTTPGGHVVRIKKVAHRNMNGNACIEVDMVVTDASGKHREHRDADRLHPCFGGSIPFEVHDGTYHEQIMQPSGETLLSPNYREDPPAVLVEMVRRFLASRGIG